MLTGKKGIIFGVANQHSLAWKIAQRCAAHGAQLERSRHRVASLIKPQCELFLCILP
jgi:enoyl-[acyl-carrier protein] reductase I